MTFLGGDGAKKKPFVLPRRQRLVIKSAAFCDPERSEGS